MMKAFVLFGTSVVLHLILFGSLFAPSESTQGILQNFPQLSQWFGTNGSVTNAAQQPSPPPPQPAPTSATPSTHLPQLQLNLIPMQSGSQPLSNDAMKNIMINPQDIQYVAPDLPNDVGQKIIDQLRQQLGNAPISLGELQNRNISFTAELPGLKVNRTVVTNVEESVVHRKSTIPYVKAPSSYVVQQPPTPVYHPAPVPSYKPPPTVMKVNYAPPPPPAEYKPVQNYAPPPPTEYKAPTNIQYAAPPPPAPEYKPPTKVNYAPPPTPEYKPTVKIEYAPPPQSPPTEYKTTVNSGYHQGPPPPSYQTYEPEPKIQYKIIEVCNGKQIAPNYEAYNDYGKVYTNLKESASELKNAVKSGYSQLADAYALVQDSMSLLEQLQNNAYDYTNVAPVLTYQVPQYQNAYSYKTPETYQYQSGYNSVDMSQYQTKTQYQAPPVHYQAPSQTAQYMASPYTYPTPPPKYTPPPPPPTPTYQNKQVYDGNNVKVSYHSEEETIQTNQTLPNNSYGY